MSVEIDVQYAMSDADADGEPPSSSEIPNQSEIQGWVEAALARCGGRRRATAELTVRIVDVPEIQMLNRDYRHKDSPTNVLSFPFEAPPGVELPLLGDIVICAAVVFEEAVAQRKSATAHWVHMVVHGVLHLLGYDHIEDDEAEQMERVEIEILADLGYQDPYTGAVA